MRLIAWLLTIALALAGLALRVQGGIPFATPLGATLLLLAGLACPLLWNKSTGILVSLGVSGKDRLMLSLALVVAMPLILL
jgi:hypothetical protein